MNNRTCMHTASRNGVHALTHICCSLSSTSTGYHKMRNLNGFIAVR